VGFERAAVDIEKKRFQMSWPVTCGKHHDQLRHMSCKTCGTMFNTLYCNSKQHWMCKIHINHNGSSFIGPPCCTVCSQPSWFGILQCGRCAAIVCSGCHYQEQLSTPNCCSFCHLTRSYGYRMYQSQDWCFCTSDVITCNVCFMSACSACVDAAHAIFHQDHNIT
jgi:hypothetical protein